MYVSNHKMLKNPPKTNKAIHAETGNIRLTEVRMIHGLSGREAGLMVVTQQFVKEV